MPVAALLGGTVPGLCAQPPLTVTLPAPLAGKITPVVSGREIMWQESARRAHDLGMPSVAADFYRQLVDAPGVDRAEMNLALATALLDAGRGEEAERVLQAMPEPHDAAWRLRTGLAAFQARRRGDAQAQWDAIKGDEISATDRAWYWFLTGALWDTAAVRDTTKANEFYLKAQAAAATELTRARFQLAGEQVRLRLLDRPSDASIRQMRDTAKQYAGRPVGYDAARTLAVALAESGQRAEAVTTLESTLRAMPARERGVIDELRFTLGMIGDRGLGGAGRNALVQLLETGTKIERQQQALQLLAQASSDEPARKQFREELDRLIAARPPHPNLESMLYYRAQLALTGKDFARAEEDAEALLKQFPLSPLRVHALGVLTQSAWEQDRFRRAADYAGKARADLAVLGGSTPGSGGFAPGRAELGVLAAEASFRGGDYRNAADAYDAVLRDRPAEFDPARLAALMYMRVLAEIRTGSSDAVRVLNEVERDPAFDLEHRWRAEWSLARDLQLRGEAGVGEAFARISALLREPAAGSELKPELRARVAWLQARLAFDNQKPEEAIRFASDLLAAPSDIDAKLKAQIASETMLLKARAEFALAREPAALETLGRLRAVYPAFDAAINSYLIEAEHYAAQDKIAEARARLIELTDNRAYDDSEYKPYALYRLALLSERLGREENLEEANRRIEELVTNPAAVGSDQALLFAARLRQGDIYRKRGDFAAAQRAYEDLVNRYPQRPDVVLALLALADCRNAQSSADVAPSTSHSDAAQMIYEQLRDRVDAPRDVRVEAGYKLGSLLARRGKIEEAARVWWQVVDDKSPTERDAKRPYWIARTLLDLGDLLEKRGSIEDAKSAYQLLLDKRLPFGEAVAQTRLQQLGLPPAKTTP
ncbi:MAG: tetratricopeptide repeat protein [Opitutaceae bacterium]